MRWLALYVRSRRLPAAIALSVGALALSWGGWSIFTDRPVINENLTILTVLLALAPLIPTMAGDDDSLESTAALRWPPRRALHLVTVVAVVLIPLLAGRWTGASFGAPGELLRNVAGLTGLIGAGVALAGTRMAWQLPICWTSAQMIFGGNADPGWRNALFWLLQPSDSTTAAVTAIVLFAAGALSYAWRVGPRPAPAEAVLGQ